MLLRNINVSYKSGGGWAVFYIGKKGGPEIQSEFSGALQLIFGIVPKP